MFSLTIGRTGLFFFTCCLIVVATVWRTKGLWERIEVVGVVDGLTVHVGKTKRGVQTSF